MNKLLLNNDEFNKRRIKAIRSSAPGYWISTSEDYHIFQALKVTVAKSFLLRSFSNHGSSLHFQCHHFQMTLCLVHIAKEKFYLLVDKAFRAFFFSTLLDLLLLIFFSGFKKKLFSFTSRRESHMFELDQENSCSIGPKAIRKLLVQNVSSEGFIKIEMWGCQRSFSVKVP